jgi:hypothetical protein
MAAIHRKLSIYMQSCLARRVVRGADDPRRPRTFECFHSEPKSKACAVSIDTSRIRVYCIWISMLTLEHPKAVVTEDKSP